MDGPHDKLQRHELLLLDIEGVDEYWGPTFRSIYESDEHKKFMENLDNRIKNHDKDIERMCNYHYQGFIESIRELLRLKTQVHELNEELVRIDSELQSSTASVMEKVDELVKARRVQKYIASTVQNLSLCLPVLTTYAKLQKQMKEKRYYPALKTLEQLEHVHLPAIANYRFSLQIRENIPQLRDKIKEAAMSDLKDFLENIRKFSQKIGEVAMSHTSEQLTTNFSILGKKKINAPPNSFIGETEYEPLPESTCDEEDLSAQDLIDFSPVYRCLHIYTVLNAKDTFVSYYRNQRQQQARLVLQPPTNMHENIAGYKSYIHSIVGFFVVEDHVLNTAGSLVNRMYLDDVWSMAISKIINALRTNFAYCTDAALMLRIKDLMMLFSTTLRNYGYPVNQLFDLLHEMRDHYNEVLMQRWVCVFREILDEETFSPIQVPSQSELERILESFPLQNETIMAGPFPKKLPFSYMVPNVYRQVKEYIYACLKFSEDLHLSQATINDMIRKSTTLLLTRTFSGSLLALFRKPGLGLLQVVQIIIDIGYLEEATVSLDDFICTITGCEKEENIGARRQAMFHVARNDAEKQISTKLKEKIDEFLELENYDWALVEPQGHASLFITDLIAFLQSVFASFTSVPSHIAQESCKAACEHIAKSMLGFILSDDVKQLTMGALQQINLDTIQCEQFAASEPVPGLEEGVLLRYFSELRQLLDLLMTWDWSTYFHDFSQENSKYGYVNPNTAITILEKLSDNKTMFSVLKKSERDKKKLLDTVLKQLRQLAQTTQQSD
ncbi:UNVERIFIED_CONTAM: hypothetical protein PYX00_003224 [Menopon gallinae]|uniref:Exocyst complex component n=1 Tax=Menopon gallinae TaxID=328185 RepID=A0AAW2I0B4_9NEOP